MLRALAFFLICAPVAHAAEQVRVQHALDKPMTLQLERLAAQYNAAQQEFEVELVRVARAPRQTVRLALPLNTARPVLYYNRDAFRRAKLDPRKAPKTWYDMAGVLGALAESGQSCPYSTAWPAWVMLENSGGTLSRQLMVRWSSMLATWEKAGFFSYSGPAAEAEARFAAGECAVLSSSSASRNALARQVHFDLGVAPLPYYADSGVRSRGLPAAAAVVWVERQSVGVTNFLAFLATHAAQAYRDRELLEEELQAVWRSGKSAPAALEAYECKSALTGMKNVISRSETVCKSESAR
jgi:ABC-type glycerol-3-phosphate transport system substrate-binding protein